MLWKAPSHLIDTLKLSSYCSLRTPPLGPRLIHKQYVSSMSTTLMSRLSKSSEVWSVNASLPSHLKLLPYLTATEKILREVYTLGEKSLVTKLELNKLVDEDFEIKKP